MIENETEIRELIRNMILDEIQNNLTIKVKCGYAGYVSVDLRYNGESVAFDSDNITIENDPEYN